MQFRALKSPEINLLKIHVRRPSSAALYIGMHTVVTVYTLSILFVSHTLAFGRRERFKSEVRVRFNYYIVASSENVKQKPNIYRRMFLISNYYNHPD